MFPQRPPTGKPNVTIPSGLGTNRGPAGTAVLDTLNAQRHGGRRQGADADESALWNVAALVGRVTIAQGRVDVRR